MSKIDVLNPHNEFLSSDNVLRKDGDLPTIPVANLIKMLKNEVPIWIFDLRSSESYAKSHIVNSKHSNCSTNLMTKKSIMKLKKEINSMVTLPSGIILYNQGNHKYNEYLQDFIENNNFNAMFLEGGFEKFAKCAPDTFIKSGIPNIGAIPNIPDVTKEDIMATEITEIEPHLYLGNTSDSGNMELLLSHGITGILCLAPETKLYFETLNIFDYKRINASDTMSQNLKEHFDESIEFIEKIKEKNGKILIHCMAGVSRSVTIVMAYMIKTYGMNVLQALDYVQKRRPIASPNLSFLGQLDRYYKELHQ